MEKTFGEFLKQKRQENNLTQKQLAKQLIVSESAVSKWEKDVSRPDISLLPKLAEILKVTEHELITASVDTKSREEKSQAKKWRTLSLSWSLFFYISYGVALLTCFICNLAVNKTLSWFWIVLSALVLSFTFTNLPQIIKKHRLILLPASMFLALVLLLGVCCIYVGGKWFWIAAMSVLLGLVIIFMPIYIARYDCFAKIKRYNDFVSIAIDFVLLNLLLIIIDLYNVDYSWYLSIALPIVAGIYLLINILLCVRFLKINKLLKTSIILTLLDVVMFLVLPLVKVKTPKVQQEIDSFNVFKANLACWSGGDYIERNICLILFLVMIALDIIFFVFGFIKHLKSKSKT